MSQWLAEKTSSLLGARTSRRALGDANVRLVAAHRGKVLDVAWRSTADGAGLIQWPWNGDANQRWRRQTV